ncbi:MAG: PQQ-dependent sugar dehydrogenase [Gammaproteobacteria bacterium]|nr:PQQ-dependent sugar dehydrogenase [Gammaproteobacteria bacterium]
MYHIKKLLVLIYLSICSVIVTAQSFPLAEGPWYYDTYAPSSRIKVSIVARGIENPWGMAFLPSGNILIAQKAGGIRIIRNGSLDPVVVTGTPEVRVASGGGLMDVVLHPDFAENRLVYFTYVKNAEPPAGADYFATTVMGRGRLNAAESALENVQEVFVADAWGTAPGGHGSRLRFAPDGTVFMSSPFRRDLDSAQNTLSDISKLLRLNDDGSIPRDNPFVGREGYLPEIWSIGHRAQEGIAYHPVTGELWASEHGPLGGDEVNIIQKGGNYGWPVVSYGRDYDGTRVSTQPWQEGMLQPEIFWVPSIATSGLMFYTGDVFPQWQNNLFVGALQTARVSGTGHVERIVFNAQGEQQREWLFADLKQRVRDVQQGPDGLIYVLTEEADGALLVIEPVE